SRAEGSRRSGTRRRRNGGAAVVRELVVVGAGGFGREVLDVIAAHNARRADELVVLGAGDDAPSDVNLSRLAAQGGERLGRAAVVVAAGGGSGGRRGVGLPLRAGGELGAGPANPARRQASGPRALGRHAGRHRRYVPAHSGALAGVVSMIPGAMTSGESSLEA